jgi:periplasmic protein TonB
MKGIAGLTVCLVLSVVQAWAQEADSTSSTTCVLPVVPAAHYPGGMEEYVKFIRKNLKYPGRGRLCVEGAVYIQFIVHEDGALSDFIVIKGVCQECDENALEALKKMPRWIPAVIGEEKKPVKCRMTMPVRFQL